MTELPEKGLSAEIRDQTMDKAKRYIIITCGVLSRECYFCAAKSRNIIDVRILEQGLHDMGDARMSERLQKEIEAVKVDAYDAILLGYGLCNNGVGGIYSQLSLVIPRAHDCITLLFGSKEKYLAYFTENPGTLYRSIGWIERGRSHKSNPESVTAQMGLNLTFEEYVEKYGEENARYLMEVLGDDFKHYNKLAYIDTAIGNFCHYKDAVRKDAAGRGWHYEELKGNVDLILRMMDGDWEPDDFLVLKPGETVQPSYDNGIIASIGR
jgi:hypothetical protein